MQKRLRDEFLPLAHVSDIRQWGYMIGIELAQDKATRKSYPAGMRVGHQVILAARQHSVMIRPLGDVIVLMPPLSMSDGELTTLLDVVHDCIVTVTEK
jgi:adenosylmethionine-8-amino-7-oxononanoate aminotransferase